ncbi:hypothetical protein BO83DRAFT_64713 [Aspergillus eucalypticola CBS 122712]|uniref:Secreted protein n=1 Tax=Aspergillus eucalypticola (strain CBS 122712 / IBT 29274) TaxID=1448314 RepID=A0A317VAY2_ASPEC|nr:uncharacterized protein BO83DRAFT_64713 [Aspergillus eucalypticola CBS 122712]PWY70092.1 hypothetical protein BO83DRAFT_64713 [Aspergillus eucalypticola CBS 122712]
MDPWGVVLLFRSWVCHWACPGSKHPHSSALLSMGKMIGCDPRSLFTGESSCHTFIPVATIFGGYISHLRGEKVLL